MSWGSASHNLGNLVPQLARPMVRRELVRYRQIGIGAADAVLVSYPKSGSTWLRFLLAHTLGGEEVDFDSVRNIIPPAGRQKSADRLLPAGGRILRTHEPLRLVTTRAGKLIYLVRDGRQVAVSYYRHLQRIGQAPASPEDYLSSFLGGQLDYYGSWHNHVLGARRPQGSTPERLFLVRYEDLLADTKNYLGRILEFVGHDPESDGIDRAIAANSRERMRSKEGASHLLQRQNVEPGSTFVGRGAERFEDVFGEGALAGFERVAGPALKEFGYPTGAGESSVAHPAVP